MRFSLGTLMLVVVWCGMGMTVWEWRRPWYIKSEVEKANSVRNGAPSTSSDGRRQFTRRFGWSQYGWGEIILVEIGVDQEPSTDEVYRGTEAALCEDLLDHDTGWNFRFVDNDTFIFETWPRDAVERQITLKRRFPEWWWGHFYRSEVWLFVLLSGVLLRRGIQTWRARWINARGSVRDSCLASSSSPAGTPA